jgi:hypothetical protein
VATGKGEASETRYLKSFVEMADRGLYSYDIETYVNPATAYFCVAMPTRPIAIEHLPINVRIILKRTVLKGLSLKAIPRIDYEATLHYLTLCQREGGIFSDNACENGVVVKNYPMSIAFGRGARDNRPFFKSHPVILTG